MLSPKAHNCISYVGSAFVFLVAASPEVRLSLPSLLWILHFSRRSVESLCLFKFSETKVSAGDSAQEFVYYWAFGFFIARQVKVSVVSNYSVYQVGWAICELCNFSCHRTLASVPRSKDGKKRRVKDSVLFSLVSCPHYFFEITSWLFFNLASSTIAGWIFMCAGAVIMTCWADLRHEEYERHCRSKIHCPIFPFIKLRPPQFLVDALK